MPAWWATLLVGLAVLLFGRRLFWLFVGAAGFAAGLYWGRLALAGSQPEWVALAAALALGLVAALLAIISQWVAVGVGGFLAGAAAAQAVAVAQGWQGAAVWIVAVLAGAVAAALLLWAWDWVLIALSALTGAVLLTSLVHLAPLPTLVVFLALFIIGVVVQGRVLEPPPPRRPDRQRSG
jgi:hypothetical protein